MLIDDNTECLSLPFLLPCVSSLDDVAAVLVLGKLKIVVVGVLLVVIEVTVAGLLTVAVAVGNRI